MTPDEALIVELRAEVARLHDEVAVLRRTNHELVRQLGGSTYSVADAAEREAREHLEREA